MGRPCALAHARAWLVVLAAVTALVAAAPSNAAAAAAARPAACIGGIFIGGVSYERIDLDRSFVRIGARLPDAIDHVGGCNDTITCVVGQPCQPQIVTPVRTPLRVHRIRGISPRAAVSEGGSSRALLIAADHCTTAVIRFSGNYLAAVSERALLRCLRSVR